jgi:hypothetical protein
MMDETRAKFDVFISYRWVDPDKTWVRKKLVPALENAGLTVCLDVNDFVPGRDLILEMTRAEMESRSVICVFSPDYFDGNRMVGFESLMARLSDPSGENSQLIPLLFRTANIPKQFRGLIPVDWTSPNDRVREWKKLLQVLEAEHLNAPDPEALNDYKGLSYKEIEILHILKNYVGFSYYKIPDIPSDLLSTGKKVCEPPEDENILGLIKLGPQRDYLLFGRNGIYFGSTLKLQKKAAIPYTEFPSRTFTWGGGFFKRISNRVEFGNSQFVIAIDISPDALTEMLNAIKKAVMDGRIA